MKKSRFARFAAAAAVILLSGCVANDASNIRLEHSDLTFGANGLRGYGNDKLAAEIASRSGLSVRPLETDDAASRVDVIVKITPAKSLIETYSARTRRLLTTGHVSFWSYPRMYGDAAQHLLTEFSPQSELYKQLVAEKRGDAANHEAVSTAPAEPKQTPVSDVDVPTRRSAERPDDFALVVGIESYSRLPSARYAEHDADAVKKHLLALGYPERNIVILKGGQATRGAIQGYVEEWLPKNTKPGSQVFIYFSGHGSPDAKSGDAYLVPWDGDAMFLKSTAYPLKSLYAALGKLKAKRVLVALDSCFSGAGGRSVLAEGARPLVTHVDAGAAPAGVTVLSAASGDEITATIADQGHGAFTYYLLKAFNDGKLTAQAAYGDLKPRVQDEAHRQNREQTPLMIGDDAAF